MTKGLGDIARKALYFGIGLASMAADKASSVASGASGQLAELRNQAKQLTDELVARGVMSAEDARTFMETVVNRSAEPDLSSSSSTPSSRTEPRKIRIDDDGTLEGILVNDSDTPSGALALSQDALLQQEVDRLQAELEALEKLKDQSD